VSRILIAEDEDQLRVGIALALRTDGHEVAEAGNGLDALQAIVAGKSAGAPFDLLICDYQMPRMTGEELLVKLRKVRAVLPTLIMTGYSEKELLVRLMRAGCRDFIDKPFEPSHLCQQIRDILADTADDALEARRKEYLALMGEKTIQTAHDLNNILSGAIGCADMALGELEHGHPLRRRIEKLLATSNRGAEICRNLLKSHRAAEDSFRVTTEINSLAARIAAVLEDVAPENVRIGAVTLDRPVWLSADAERLQQALLNLGFNAIASMPTGGNLTISVAYSVAARPGLGGREQPCVVLSVRDTGHGLPPQMKERLFENRPANREDGHGFGLGIVKKIVEFEHGGWMAVEPEWGKGTTFSLYFPTERITS